MDTVNIVYDLEDEEIICDGDVATIREWKDVRPQNQCLHKLLVRKCTKEALMAVCDIMIRYKGNPKMNQLGKDMKRKLEGMCCVYHTYMCAHLCVCVTWCSHVGKPNRTIIVQSHNYRLDHLGSKGWSVFQCGTCH